MGQFKTNYITFREKKNYKKNKESDGVFENISISKMKFSNFIYLFIYGKIHVKVAKLLMIITQWLEQ